MAEGDAGVGGEEGGWVGFGGSGDDVGCWGVGACVDIEVLQDACTEAAGHTGDEICSHSR